MRYCYKYTSYSFVPNNYCCIVRLHVHTSISKGRFRGYRVWSPLLLKISLQVKEEDENKREKGEENVGMEEKEVDTVYTNNLHMESSREAKSANIQINVKSYLTDLSRKAHEYIFFFWFPQNLNFFRTSLSLSPTPRA